MYQGGGLTTLYLCSLVGMCGRLLLHQTSSTYLSLLVTVFRALTPQCFQCWSHLVWKLNILAKLRRSLSARLYSLWYLNPQSAAKIFRVYYLIIWHILGWVHKHHQGRLSNDCCFGAMPWRRLWKRRQWWVLIVQNLMLTASSLHRGY